MSEEGSSSAPSASRKWLKRGLMGLGAVIVLVLVAAGSVFAITSSRMSKKYDVQPEPLAVKPSADMVARGAEIATYRGCHDCHGENLAGRVVADAMPVMKLAGPNITPGGVTKGYTDEDWARAIRHGIRPDGSPLLFMPSYEYVTLSHEDTAAIIAYARSVPAIDKEAVKFEVGPLGRVLYLAGELPLVSAEMIDHSTKPANPTPGPTAEYGRYLATSCTGCHGEGFSGGKIPGVPPEWPSAANLTMHETGLAGWTFEDFRETLRTGKTPEGKELNPMYMPWQYVSESSDDDLRALWEHFQTVEPRPYGTR